MRILACLLALAFASGCWVVDELDSGMKIMESHTPKTKPKGGAEREQAASAPGPGETTPAPAPAQGPGILHDLVVWTKKKLEGPPPPPDPADVPVRCTIGQSMLFTTRGECEARRGRAVELPPKS